MSGSEIAKYGEIAVPDGQILAQLNYPWSVGRGNSFINSEQPVWRGLLDHESLQQIVDSPARKSIREKSYQESLQFGSFLEQAMKLKKNLSKIS